MGGTRFAPRAGKTRSQKNACKWRRIPPVGCTLCWHAFDLQDSLPKKDNAANLTRLLHEPLTLATTKKSWHIKTLTKPTLIKRNADFWKPDFLKNNLAIETDLILLSVTCQKLDQRKKPDKLDWTRLTRINDRRWTLILEADHNRPETQKWKLTQPIKTFADQNADRASRFNLKDIAKFVWNFYW